MGQCYTVIAKFNFKDAKEFCGIIAKEITRMQGYAVFDLARGKLNDPFGCFKILTSKDAFIDDDGTWCADFDGSYGWETVMDDIFEASATALKDGSYIHIYPDDGVDKIEVVNGQVNVCYEENGHRLFLPD